MHKAAMEMGKWAMEKAKACGYDNLCPQDWEELRNCMEAASYAACAEKDYLIVEAMKEQDEEEKVMSKMGYNNRRYSDGRYAPRGRGTSYGYYPPEMEGDEYMREYLHDPSMFAENMRMGYRYMGDLNTTGNVPGTGDAGHISSNQSHMVGYRSPHGMMYDRYMDARRNYTETKDPEAAKDVKKAMADVFDDLEMMTADMWKDMSAEDKVKYKNRLMAMAQKMPTA